MSAPCALPVIHITLVAFSTASNNVDPFASITFTFATCLFVFICDSLAWFFGVLFGKSTRGYVAASPNKSLVGFIGGISCSIIEGFLFKCIFPEKIPFSYIEIFILGFLTAIASIIGDLIESVFKRSSGVKDSGNIIPGRGGVLDSIDSIVIAVPVFYICQYFFNLI